MVEADSSLVLKGLVGQPAALRPPSRTETTEHSEGMMAL